MPADYASLGIGAVQGVIGGIQKIKAAQIARGNIRPVLKDDPALDEAYNLTGSRAQNGLSVGSKEAYLGNSDRMFASSVDAILQGGGSVNNVSDLYEGAQTGLRTLALANQQAQKDNIDAYLNVLSAKATEDRDQFVVNEEAPFKDKAALAASLSAEGSANIWKGINTVVGGAVGAINPYAAAAQGSGGAAAPAATNTPSLAPIIPSNYQPAPRFNFPTAPSTINALPTLISPMYSAPASNPAYNQPNQMWDPTRQPTFNYVTGRYE